MSEFSRRFAVVIGINQYENGIPTLQNAVNDAEQIKLILEKKHGYETWLFLDQEATQAKLTELLTKTLREKVEQDDCLLFYFAGHGIAEPEHDGPQGYLIPQDAIKNESSSYLQMKQVHDWLIALPCRHFLAILDCCFAGAFRWSSTRDWDTQPEEIYQEHYDRFIKYPAWQVITSASYDETAQDKYSLRDCRGKKGDHSPFAEALIDALEGKADSSPPAKDDKPAGDGVITAYELYVYLDHCIASNITSESRQTPQLLSLKKHDRGQYIFLTPGHELNLRNAPPLDESTNPYRGLESFDEEHSRFFFGRKKLIQKLSERISAPNQPLTVVLGVSGSGKSSLVKAGLIPYLKNPPKSEETQSNPVNTVYQWRILKPMRPQEHPFTSLAKAIFPLADVTGSNQSDTLNFINVSDRLDTLTFLTEVLQQKLNDLKVKLDESSIKNGEESAKTLRLKKEVEKLNSITETWRQDTQKDKQLLIVEHFEELYDLCQKKEEKQQSTQPSPEQQQLQQAVSDCLAPLSKSLQSNPNQLIDIVKVWSQRNPDVKLLLTIDQFEELITLSRSKQKDQQNNQQQQRKKLSNQPTQEVQQENQQKECQLFLNLLGETLSANLKQLRIIVTLRSDFEPRFSIHEALKSHWKQALFPVKGMETDELREAIERPASEMALIFDPPTLVDELMAKVGQMPGTLPLLSFILSELYIKLAEDWNKGEKSDRALRLDADFDTGEGLIGLLTRKANNEYNNLPDDAHKDTLRRVMLRMVATEGGELARRRVSWSELEYADKEENDRVDLVLKRFIDHARLIVRDGDYVEPAHDFLVKNWGELQQWQQDEQEDLSLQRRLTQVAIEWKNKKQSSSLLGKSEPFLDWCDKKIDSVEDWLNHQIKKDDQQSQQEKKRQFLWNGNPYLDVLKNRLKAYDHWFNQVEAEFVQQSVWQRRRYTNMGRVIAGGVIIIAIIAFYQWINAERRLISTINALTEASQELFDSNQEFDAFLASLKAGKLAKQAAFGGVSPDMEYRINTQLQQAADWVKERNRLKGHEARVFSVSLSSDRRLLASGGADGSIKLWNVATGEPIKPLPGHIDAVHIVSFSPNGQLLASASASDHTVKLWNITTSQEISSFKGYDSDANGNKGISFSPDGRLLAYASGKTIILVNVERREEIKKLTEHGNTVTGISFSPDRKILASASSDGTVKLWNLATGQVIDTLDEHRTWVFAVSFSPDGKMLASGADGGGIKLWNLANRKSKPYDLSTSGRVTNLSFSPNGQLLIASGFNNAIKLWDVATRKEIKPLTGHSAKVNSVSVSSDGQLLASASSDATIKLWDIKERKEINLLSGHNDFVNSVSFSPDGKLLASAGDDATIKLWDIKERKWIGNLERHSHWVESITFSRSGKLLASASWDTTIKLWNVAARKEIAPLKGHSGWVTSVSFSPDERLLASASWGGTVKLWDITAPKEPKEIANLEHKGDVFSVSFSPNERLLASASGDKTIKLWDITKPKEPKEIATWEGHDQEIRSVNFSPDGKLLASAGDDATIKLWDITTPEEPEEVGTLKGHKLTIHSVSFSPDGKLLASASDDQTIRFWDVATRKEVNVLNGHRAEVKSISFSSDKQHLASGDSSGQVAVWNYREIMSNFTLDNLLGRSCDWLRGYLKNKSNGNVEEGDRNLCDDIPRSTPPQQTTIVPTDTPSSSAPANAPAPPQNVPSPTPSSNNGQNTPSSSAPANVPARPQNVPSPTPSSNNGQ